MKRSSICLTTGTIDKAPSPYYDPLEYIVQKAHAKGIEVHAWFNPYRARAGSSSTQGLPSSHVVHRFPNDVHPYGSNLWMDPGSKPIQDFIVQVFADVVRRYDIDGVHMDDYFYPYPEQGVDFPDSTTFRHYQSSGGQMSLADWRRDNVNTLVHRLDTEIHAIKPYIKFGISPFGIWKPGNPAGIHGLSAYDSLYADARHWFRAGWVDYMAPQLYWRIDPPAQSYPALLDWWLQQNNNHKHLYAGNFAGNAIIKHWGVQEILNQIQISRDRRSQNSLGNIQFSMKYFLHNDLGISDSFEALHYSKTLTPAMPWLNVPTSPVPTVNVQGHTLTWSGDATKRTWRVVVYKQKVDNFDIVDILDKNKMSIQVEDGDYAVTSLARNGMESNATYVPVVGGNAPVIVG